jgi:hypothetical protein
MGATATKPKTDEVLADLAPPDLDDVQLPPELTGPHPDDYVLRPERFQPMIEEFRAMHNAALEHGRHLTDEKAALRHAIHLEQYRLAVDNLRLAQRIPINAEGKAQKTQFGTQEMKMWRFHVPPGGIPSQEKVEDWLVQGDHYRVITDNPIHIAYLRQLVEKQSIPGLREQEVGLVAMFGPKGAFGGWFPQEAAEMVKRGGMDRGW